MKSYERRRELPSSVQTLTVAEAAAALRIHRKTLYELFDRGELRYVMVGSRRRVRVPDLESYLERSAKMNLKTPQR